MAGIDKPDVQFDAIVNEVASEAHLNRSLLLPEEIEYIREHALNKPLGVIHIWALGVGVVITGMYFGWNFGLPVAGPIGMLIASLIVCGLYLTWVLALSELSVAILLNPEHPGQLTTTICAIVCAVVFLILQYIGVKEQAAIMLWLTWAAIGALVCFFVAVIPGVSLER